MFEANSNEKAHPTSHDTGYTGVAKCMTAVVAGHKGGGHLWTSQYADRKICPSQRAGCHLDQEHQMQ